MFGFGTNCGDSVGGLADALVGCGILGEDAFCMSVPSTRWGSHYLSERRDMSMVLCGHAIFGCLLNTQVHMKALSSGQMYYR